MQVEGIQKREHLRRQLYLILSHNKTAFHDDEHKTESKYNFPFPHASPDHKIKDTVINDSGKSNVILLLIHTNMK